MRARILCCILACVLVLCGPAACNNASDSQAGAATGENQGKPEAETGPEAEKGPEAREEMAAGSETCSISDEVLAYLSNREELFTLQENFVKIYEKRELVSDDALVIQIDGTDKGQEICGFGASFTDTAAHVLMAMPEEERNQAMTYLFDEEEGIGISLIRNCMGASDFALDYYTYDDMPQGEEDWELAHFDFSHDLEQIVPLTKQALAINPDARVILSPWTAPLWMKTEYAWGNMSKLRLECYDVYARYLVKVVKAYEDAGVPVYAITPQNEMFAVVEWPSMYWDDWESMSNFINNNLRPALEAEGLDTRILALDHNYRFHEEADSIMAATMQTADGIAYHAYEGEPEEMASTRDYFTDKLILVSEASSSVQGTSQKLAGVATKIGRAMRSGANGFLAWNMALSPTGGPTYNNVNNHCTGLLACDMEANEISYDAEYYAMAHFSKFIHDGAVLLGSTDTGEETKYKLVNVVAANPNGSMVAVLVNSDGKEARTVRLVLGERVMEVTVGPRSVVTLTWDGNFQD